MIQLALDPEVERCLEDVLSHHHDFVRACASMVDTDGYWDHQVKTLDRLAQQAAKALGRPTPELSSTLSVLRRGEVYMHRDGRKGELVGCHPHDGALLIFCRVEHPDDEITEFYACERSDLVGVLPVMTANVIDNPAPFSVSLSEAVEHIPTVENPDDGCLYDWPNEIVSLVLNVGDDIRRLGAVAGAEEDILRPLIDSLTNALNPAKHYMQTQPPGVALAEVIDSHPHTGTVRWLLNPVLAGSLLYDVGATR